MSLSIPARAITIGVLAAAAASPAMAFAPRPRPRLPRPRLLGRPLLSRPLLSRCSVGRCPIRRCPTRRDPAGCRYAGCCHASRPVDVRPVDVRPADVRPARDGSAGLCAARRRCADVRTAAGSRAACTAAGADSPDAGCVLDPVGALLCSGSRRDEGLVGHELGEEGCGYEGRREEGLDHQGLGRACRAAQRARRELTRVPRSGTVLPDHRGRAVVVRGPDCVVGWPASAGNVPSTVGAPSGGGVGREARRADRAVGAVGDLPTPTRRENRDDQRIVRVDHEMPAEARDRVDEDLRPGRRGAAVEPLLADSAASRRFRALVRHGRGGVSRRRPCCRCGAMVEHRGPPRRQEKSALRDRGRYLKASDNELI